MGKCCHESCPYWHQEIEYFTTYDNRIVKRDLSKCIYNKDDIFNMQKRLCQGADIYKENVYNRCDKN